MINNRSTFFLGLFIFIIPFLGLPSSWKTILFIVSGLYLIFLSVTFVMPAKRAAKPRKKEKSLPVFVENIPMTPIHSQTEADLPDISHE